MYGTLLIVLSPTQAYETASKPMMPSYRRSTGWD